MSATTLSSHDLTHSTRSVLTGLESLRQEHNLLLGSTTDDNKRSRLLQSADAIDLGIGESLMMVQLGNHLENLDCDTLKLMLQVQRLTQENSWLRDELTSTEKHLQTSLITRQEYERDIRLLNESLAVEETESTSEITGKIDIDKDMPLDVKERAQITNDSEGKTKNSSGTNHSEVPPRFRTLHNLVIQYAQAGRYEVAVPLCRQALEDLEKSHGHNHPDVATMLNILALVYRDQNKFKEALQLLNEALTIREQTLGLDHPAVAATLNNLAVLYGKKNRYKEAEPLCKRALEIREKCFGVDHPDVGKQLNNLALLCLNQGKYDKVEEYYKRAIEIYSKHYGANDPNVAKTKNNLASAYLREGKFKLAAQLYKEVLAESQLLSTDEQSINLPPTITTPLSARDGSTVLTTLKNLGAICRRQGLYEQAELIEACASKSTQDPQAIDRALAVLRQIRIHDDTNNESMRRSQRSQPPVSGNMQQQPEYGRLRRSGSFQKLRQSIRRGSEKLVQKLRGGTGSNLPTSPSTGWNNEPFHPAHTQQDQGYGPIKRASSMSVLNTPPSHFPLQQQQPNRPLAATYSIDQSTVPAAANVSLKQFPPPVRGRLTSAENFN